MRQNETNATTGNYTSEEISKVLFEVTKYKPKVEIKLRLNKKRVE